MASAAAVVAACKSASSAPEKYSSSGCANQRARQFSTAASTGLGVAPKLPWFSRAMPGAWWSKSDANAGALARVNDDEVAALLARAARALDNDGNRIDAAQSRVHSGSGSLRLCARGAYSPSRHPSVEVSLEQILNLLRWPHERLVERAVLRR